MLNLKARITITPDVTLSPNLCDRFEEDDLKSIGEWMHELYNRDVASREKWRKRTELAMDLAMQVQKDKTWPWQGCSNIVFPLVTIAAMQFHSRAYPAIVNGRRVVQCQVWSADPQGTEKIRADKVSKHMSWQLLEQDESWEEELDTALLNLAIVGCGFKKTFWEGDHPSSCYVPANKLVFDYWAKSVDKCQFKTHVIPLYRNEIWERVQEGKYVDVLEEAWYQAPAQIPTDKFLADHDKRKGQEVPTADEETPFTCLEHHCWLDLDGDGYREPYIVTTEYGSGTVLRIVARWDREEDIERNKDGKLIRIVATEYFTKLPMIPSPDGGALDIGFGVLLGPLNESVNAAINQLFDAGTLSNTAGGFLGRGAKLRGGNYEFKPFSWNRVDSTGDDLRKNIFPLPVREPSAVMFNLLTLIIDFTQRVSGSTDAVTGENPGQNTPAETHRSMLEQGQKIYSAIFKRIWRGMKREFKKIYQLNAMYLPVKMRYGSSGDEISREDYTGSAMGITPAADPTIVSESAKFTQALTIKEAAATNPAYDADEVEKDFLRALGVTDVERLYKGVANVPQVTPEKIQIQQMKNEVAMAQLQQKQQQFVMQLQQNSLKLKAEINKIEAQAYKLMEEGKAKAGDQQIQAFRAAIEMLRLQDDALSSQIDSLMEIGKDANIAGFSGRAIPFLEGTPGNSASV